MAKCQSLGMSISGRSMWNALVETTAVCANKSILTYRGNKHLMTTNFFIRMFFNTLDREIYY